MVHKAAESQCDGMSAAGENVGAPSIMVIELSEAFTAHCSSQRFLLSYYLPRSSSGSKSVAIDGPWEPNRRLAAHQSSWRSNHPNVAPPSGVAASTSEVRRHPRR